MRHARVGRSTEVPLGARIIDLSDSICLPGFIDCHTDPRRDLHLLESVPFVMKGGAILKHTRSAR